jgi:hypothetical protein
MPRVSQPGHRAPVAPSTPAGGAGPDLLPRLTWSLLFAALLVFQAYVIFVQRHGATATAGHETRVAGEVAGGVSIRQTFRMAAGGLDGITVHVRPSGMEHAGPVILELAEAGDDPAGAADAPVYRAVVDTRRVVDDPTFTWQFTPLDDSDGRLYALRVSMPAAPFGHGVSLLATRDEHYLDGRFWFDGREQWGDLVLETSARRATTFQRFEHALRDKPWWLRSRVTFGLLFAFYNLALGVVLWTFLAAQDESAEATGSVSVPASPPGRVFQRARAAGVAALVLVCALAAYVAYVPRVRLEPGARELVDEFPETVKRTTLPSLQQGFVYETVTWRGRRMRCITALPFSRIYWTVEAPAGTELRGWYGMRPDAWQGNGDGSTFRVGINDGGRYDEKVRRWLNPDREPLDRGFVPIRVSLAPYVGRRVEIVLNTEPELTPVGDAAMWCEVRVVEN